MSSTDNFSFFSLKNQLSNKEKLGGKLSGDEQSKVEKVINEKIAWLEENQVASAEDLKAQKKEMKDIVQPIIAKSLGVEDDKYITLLVNNLPVTVRKDIRAKTMLTIYCQQNKLLYPDYKISLVNPKEKEWRLFKARFKLNGREAFNDPDCHV